MKPTATTKLRAMGSSQCEHDGTCSGMLSLSEGKRTVIMAIVCDACGAEVRQLGEIVHQSRPRLSSVTKRAA